MRTITRGLELFYVELATDLKSVLFGVKRYSRAFKLNG